jgi:hypothetical protein
MILLVISICLALLRLVPRVRPLVELYLPSRLQWLPSAVLAAAGALSIQLSQQGSILDNVEILITAFVALVLAAQKGADGKPLS